LTGASKETAKQMLGVYHGNVEMAINMFLEDQDGASSSSNVRDPIPPQQEILVETSGFQGFPGRSKRAVHSVFDSFRDFQVETRKFVLATNRRKNESFLFLVLDKTWIFINDECWECHNMLGV
jgi:hypothetical protein